MKMRFYTPSYGVAEEFGAATFGMTEAYDEKASHSSLFPLDIKGKIYSGTYEECLKAIENGNWKVGIVLFGNAGNENEFISELTKKVNVPLVGGGAAINPVTGESALVFGRGEVAVFMIDDEDYDFEVFCENIHHDIISEHKISFSDLRVVDKIDGVDPKQWFLNKREQFNLDANDFEHITLADENGINAHLCERDGKICSGRDLCEKMYLRYLPEDKVLSRMESFYDDENAITFGCAGLKGILPSYMNTKGMGLFMFGEVCTKDGVSEFGNLMLSKIRILKK